MVSGLPASYFTSRSFTLICVVESSFLLAAKVMIAVSAQFIYLSFAAALSRCININTNLEQCHKVSLLWLQEQENYFGKLCASTWWPNGKVVLQVYCSKILHLGNSLYTFLGTSKHSRIQNQISWSYTTEMRFVSLTWREDLRDAVTEIKQGNKSSRRKSDVYCPSKFNYQ